MHVIEQIFSRVTLPCLCLNMGCSFVGESLKCSSLKCMFFSFVLIAAK